MSYEDQIIREATGQGRDFELSHDCPKCELHFSDCVCEPEPEEPIIDNETGDQQGEMICENCGKPITSKFYIAQAGTRKVWHWSACNAR